MAPTARDLIKKNRHAWRIAVENPFVSGLHGGVIEHERLARWIVAGRARLSSLFSLVSRLLAVAPRADREVLLDVLTSMQAELCWIDAWMKRRGIDPDAPVNPVVRSQIAFHTALALQPYVVGLVVCWGDLRLTSAAWKPRTRRPVPNRELLSHWNEVRSLDWPKPLERAASRALAAATPKELAVVEEAFRRLIENRLAFWTMALS
jgi:thiaminase